MSISPLPAEHNGRTGFVTVLSDNPNFSLAITELQGAETRKLAIQKAASAGLPDPRVNGLAAPYACKADGEPVTRVGEKIDHYRIDIPVTSGR